MSNVFDIYLSVRILRIAVAGMTAALKVVINKCTASHGSGWTGGKPRR
jgi:hypothetical protein